ncbi:alkaline shock response membrane anchor protein AmaP [Lentilactobacillus sp. SPB1-3]|uniref:Alkaline shock response membrane anchor protein AmaP n=1 Tax=Lentilactobacillus terminaliae TaxID=3003483 RepID=A0ACD5DDX5_9LACO|nr:alkaline shock response membrane anchor protein AmaP [Lentilactobacillus sp. SPB1-3]MCZ0977472.1 alkaline shock response membrane anchor protein AmaP [Lentilactobacillus sp. SPB1-3]
MNRYIKWIIGIISLVALVQAVWFISIIVHIPYLSEWFETAWINNQGATEITALVLAGMTILLVLIIFGLLGISRTTQKDLQFRSNQGNLVVSKDSLEQMVNQTIADSNLVGNIETKVSINRSGQRVKANVKAINLSDDDYRTVAKKIQQVVDNCLALHLGIPSKTKVRLVPLSKSTQRLKVM